MEIGMTYFAAVRDLFAAAQATLLLVENCISCYYSVRYVALGVLSASGDMTGGKSMERRISVWCVYTS